MLGQGKECGDSFQIMLAKSLSPLACKELVANTPACGNYFEMNSNNKWCRCTPPDETCKLTNDASVVAYRIHDQGEKTDTF